MDKSLDEMIVETGGSVEDGARPAYGGGKKGKRGSDSFGGQRYEPYPTQKGGKGRKGGKGKKGAFGVRWQPDVNEPWLHDKFDDGTGAKQFYKETAASTQQDMLECKVHMSNVPWDWQEGDLKEVFSTVVPVKRISIYYDNAGRNSGAGMATFNTPEEAAKAIAELNGAKLGAKELSLKPAKASTLQTSRRTSGFGEAVSRFHPDREVRIRIPGQKAAETAAKTVSSKDALDQQLLAFVGQAGDAKPEPVQQELQEQQQVEGQQQQQQQQQQEGDSAAAPAPAAADSTMGES